MWRFVPLKEVCIGCLFASGTVAALVPRVGLSGDVTCGCPRFFRRALFVELYRHRHLGTGDLDLTQGKNSIATRWS